MKRKEIRKKMYMVCSLTLVGVGAFFYGRHGASSRVAAQSPAPFAPMSPPATPSDYSRRPVAFLFDNTPITREELGEFLIARYGADKLEILVNRKIVEMACKARGIYVSEAEIEAQLRDDIRALGGPTMKLTDFENQVLKRFNKTLYEFKEDAIRPKLALAKMIRSTLTVTEEDLKKGFEARYGEKVQCRMIVVANDKHRFSIHEAVRKDEATFAEYARKQMLAPLASIGGKVPPIHKHFGDPQLEKTAFSLKVGEVSELIQLEDKTWAILKCDEKIPANVVVKFEEERTKLYEEIFNMKLAQEIPKLFNRLRAEARPHILLARNQIRQEDLEREVRREIDPIK